MAQGPYNVKVTVSSAGTRVPLLASNSPYRFARSVTVEATNTNAGPIYLGGALVEAALYSTVLNGNDKDRTVTIAGDPVDGPGGSHRNCVDLNAWYVDAGTSGDSVMVTVEIQTP